LSAVKRSKVIRLVLLGGFSAGALAVGATAVEPRISSESVYTNDYFVKGAGYYHAPFNAFYAQSYNLYDQQKKMYFYGGSWHPRPHRSIVNLSAPTAQAALAAEAARAADYQRGIHRSGFGSTSRSHSIRS
jgi:hypothetical protein